MARFFLPPRAIHMRASCEGLNQLDSKSSPRDVRHPDQRLCLCWNEVS
jgi:hypothetical protein